MLLIASNFEGKGWPPPPPPKKPPKNFKKKKEPKQQALTLTCKVRTVKDSSEYAGPIECAVISKTYFPFMVNFVLTG
jgi:hypothetical protein